MPTKKPKKKASATKAKAPAKKKVAAAKAKPRRAPARRAPKKAKPAAKPAKRQSMHAPVQTMDLPAFTSSNPVDAYNHFLPLVQSYAPEDVAVVSISASVVRRNVSRAFSSVQPFLSMAGQLVPSVSIERLMELPTLALALEFAERHIPSRATHDDIEDALSRVTDPRELSLSYLEVAAGLGLLDAQRVADIRAGSGKLDKAQDCVDIGAVFREHSSLLAGKHPFPPGYVEDMAATGAWLVQHLTPKGAVRDRASRALESDTRDRFYRAVRERYDDLEKVAVALWGLRGANENVPALLSHERSHAPSSVKSPSSDATAMA